MKTTALALIAAAIALQSTAAFANIYCTKPLTGLRDSAGNIRLDEQQAAHDLERELWQLGIDAQDSRFWNDCLQTFVLEDGVRVMRFYDPYSLRERTPEQARSF
jgi:hypothetical protein